MKNLKKVLALVLVVATLMSFATVASAKYTDDSSINYDEAVAVMSEIGVINGYTDNSFRPTANVTRAQMAKMVAYIVAGGEDVGALYAGANSFSDCTTHWAKGYIAYANKTGIVAGVGGGKFNPDGSVTGTQAAKMMLCALGYDSDAEGYTGTNWAVNVLSDARDAGLLKDLENVNMSVAMTREQAAQLMFNALKADMVEYDRGNISIENGDTSIIIGGSAAKKVANTSSDYTKANGKWDKDDSDSVMQLCEKYFPKLNVTATKADAFGAAAHAWKYDKGDELVFADEPILTYTAAVTGKDLFSDVKNAGYKMEATGKADTAPINVYRNNNTVSNTETVTNSSAKSYGGNGIELNVYAGTDDVIYVTAKVTYLAEITGIAKDKTNTSADERSLSVKYKDANNNEVNTVKLNADTTGFDAIYDGAKVGDKLLITPKGDNTSATTALTVSSVKSETGKITAVNSSANTITFNGTKYELAGVSKASNYTVSKDDVTVYFDANGYVIGSTSIASSGDKSLVVMKAFQGLDADGALVPKANVVFSDGTVQTVQLNTQFNGTAPVVKTYTEKDGVYTLGEVTTTAADGAVMAFNSNKTTLAADGKKLTLKDGASGSTYYFTSDVKFISVKDGKATVYDGVQKFSNLDGAAVLTKVGDNLQISTVYILGSTDTASTTSDELIYVKGGKTGTVLIEDANESSGYKTYYTYDAYINGEKVDGFYATTDNASAGFYKNEKTDAGAYVLANNGYGAENGNVITGAKFNKLINGTILNAGNVDYDVANAVVTDLTDNDITSAVDIDNAASENNVTLAMVFDKDTKTVDYIYVTGVSAK